MPSCASEKIDKTIKSEMSASELCTLAADGLVDMLNPDGKAFCFIYERSSSQMVRQGVSPRYTLMSLLGLHRWKKVGNRSPLNEISLLEGLLQDTGWINSAGDLGLLLWTCAELIPTRLPEIYHQVSGQNALTRFSDAHSGVTMHLAWFLTGVSTCILAGHGNLPNLQEQAHRARLALERNCGADGVFRHLGYSLSLKSVLRGRIGSFADQVYPTIAFARLSQAMNDNEARKIALRTANKMCECQGPLGEWYWHYDSKSGKVISRYPIYSVHQHAMGPMMLFAASEATGHDFNSAIAKSIAWVSGKNELNRDFVDRAFKLVWRCIYLGHGSAYIDAALRAAGLKNTSAVSSKLSIRYECRPYELGWLLYAFAGKSRF